MSRKLLIPFLLLVFFNFSYSSSVKNMNKKLKNIDKEIKKKNTRIHTIDNETLRIKKNITEIEEEIKIIENDRKKIEEEIEVVKKRVEYGEKNLKISDVEHSRKEMEYIAKIIAWDKYSKLHSKELEEKTVLKKQYRELLYGDLKRMEKIEKITENIAEVKAEIEEEKRNLDGLRKKLENNLSQSDKKKIEREKLIEKLGREKKGHQSSIQKLKREKIRISREIERIIRQQIEKARREAARREAARKAAAAKIAAARKAAAAKKKNQKIKAKVIQKSRAITSNSLAYKKMGKTIKPISGAIVVRFKERKAGVVQSNGIEIRGRVGGTVVAAKSGTVIYADKFQGLGKVIMIDYGGEIIGVYGNLLALKAKYGSKVKTGEKIGVLGLSSDKKPNLYYEIRVNLKPIDPIPTF